MKLIRARLKHRDYLILGVGILITLLVLLGINLINNMQTPLAPQSPTITTKWLPSTVTHWKAPINEMAKKYNIDPNLVAIIVTVESGGYAKAKSEAGAQGLMQVTPLTAKDIAAKYLKKPITKYNLMDPHTNIEFGTAYLAFLRDYFGDVDIGPDSISLVELIGAGYNGGPGTAQAMLDGEGLIDTQPVIYSRDAFNMWRERHASSSPTFDRWKERGGSTLIDKAKNS
jgi:soluble lytic murein transglycosylase-like protein